MLLLLWQIGLAENCGIHARRMLELLLGRLACSRVLLMITCKQRSADWL